MASTPLSRAHRWLRTYLRDHYALERQRSHPVHTSMQSTVYFPLKGGNVWLTISVDFMCFEGWSPTLTIYGNRCGPEARLTCDGPVEKDFNLPGVPNDSWTYAEFDESALLALKSTVLNNLPAALKAYHDEVAKYAAQKVPLLG